jgi:uncharacterized protein YndB with AHSA1/START domain
MKKFLTILTLFAGSLLVCRAAKTILFSENFANGISSGWENKAYFKTPTIYEATTDGTNFCVRGVSQKTCSALTHELKIEPPKKLILRWRWKIDGVNPNGSERNIKKFDHAARVVVAFDTFIGPPRTLNYMWGDVEKAGTVLEHPKSGRAQIFVLESGDAKAGQWISEERDVTADWQKVFGDRRMPKIVGIALMTDSDSLGKKLVGYYSDIELIAE